MDLGMLNLLISVLLCFMMAALGYYFHKITTQLNEAAAEVEDLKSDLGGVFNVFMTKLEKFEELVPDIEPANPFIGLIHSIMENQTPKDRDGSGQFIRAEVIPPSDD